MKKIHISWTLFSAMATMLFFAASVSSCGGGEQKPVQKAGADEQLEETPAHRNPLFSLYHSKTDGTYMIYRNGEKISTFSLGDSRRPIKMCSRNGDCFVLVSESRRADSTDSSGIAVRTPAEILKNGRRAMVMDNALKALDFDMSEGHFYVLGRLGDSVYTVYRDGLRILSYPVREGNKPVDMSVFQQTVYLAQQRGNTVDIYQGDKKISSLPGKCLDLKVSLRGVYTLVPDSLYLNNDIIMHNEFYRQGDKEMRVNPTMLATSDKNLLVGGRATFDRRHTYASVFLNQQTYATVKPDDKRLGDSDLNTLCCGVALSGETVYYVTTNLSPSKEQMQPLTFVYHIDRFENFRIQFENQDVRLLMIASD